jgi:hypothetical protein
LDENGWQTNRRAMESGHFDAQLARRSGPGMLIHPNPIKAGKTSRKPETESSFRNNRNCKNTAVGCAGQARTTIGSVLLGLRCTNLGNPGNLMCKTAKAAPFGQKQSHSCRAFRHWFEASLIWRLSQGAEVVQTVWPPVRVVD